MLSQAEHLATQLTRANEELIAVVERCSDAQWHAICPAEGWTVGVTAHHVAADYADLLEIIEATAAGRPVPAWARELIDQRNAEHAQRFARCTQQETIALLRRNATLLADTIRRLSDKQLSLTARLLDREKHCRCSPTYPPRPHPHPPDKHPDGDRIKLLIAAQVLAPKRSSRPPPGSAGVSPAWSSSAIAMRARRPRSQVAVVHHSMQR